MNYSVKAIRAKVVFFEGLKVDGYKMPDGEFRVGLSDASKILGYNREWLSDSIDRKSPRTAKALSELDFSQNIQKVTAQSNQGNWFEDRTISLEDFNCCILYAVQKGKKPAIALQKSFTHLALNDFFRDAFDELPLTIEEKRAIFYRTYAASITPADWRKMDRQDILDLAFMDSDDPVLNGSWNSWQEEKEMYDVI